MDKRWTVSIENPEALPVSPMDPVTKLSPRKKPRLTRKVLQLPPNVSNKSTKSRTVSSISSGQENQSNSPSTEPEPVDRNEKSMESVQHEDTNQENRQSGNTHYQRRHNKENINPRRPVDQANVCYDFQNRGSCRRGRQCPFNHIPPSESLCMDWSAGYCPRGDHCRFSHEYGLDDRSSREKSESVPPPVFTPHSGHLAHRFQHFNPLQSMNPMAFPITNLNVNAPGTFLGASVIPSTYTSKPSVVLIGNQNDQTRPMPQPGQTPNPLMYSPSPSASMSSPVVYRSTCANMPYDPRRPSMGHHPSVFGYGPYHGPSFPYYRRL